MSRRRQLSDEENALWTSIARAIRPLRPVKTAVKTADKTADKTAVEAEAPATTGNTQPVPRHAIRRDQSPSPAKSLPLAPLDRRLRQRLARGRDEIEARIDLHGLTQREAHAALLSFLRRAQTDGAKIALVVTGKGRREDARDGATERGVLRRQVPMWLALPEFRPFVVGFDEAHMSHGGQGALYVRLRRAR
jgi:DNA-nicking Smr family endonuclease